MNTLQIQAEVRYAIHVNALEITQRSTATPSMGGVCNVLHAYQVRVIVPVA